MPPAVIEFRRVTKIYRTGLLRRRPVCALRDVTLVVPGGCVFGVIGPNRAGKTTLAKVLLSICRATSGIVLRLGQPAVERRTLARVGYVHESHAFPRYLTAAAVLRYYGGLSGLPRRELLRRIPRLLDEVGLADRAAEPISTFSKGMAQRLALAQALVNDPDLLVLDEPAEGMDLAARASLDEVIRRRRNEGKTTLLISHGLADIQRLCDQTAVLRAGEVAFAGPLSDLAPSAAAPFPSETLCETLEHLCVGGPA